MDLPKSNSEKAVSSKKRPERISTSTVNSSRKSSIGHTANDVKKDLAKNSTGSISDVAGLLYTEQGLQNVADLICMLRDEKHAAIRKSKEFACRFMAIFHKRLYQRELFETLWTLNAHAIGSKHAPDNGIEGALFNQKWTAARCLLGSNKHRATFGGGVPSHLASSLSNSLNRPMAFVNPPPKSPYPSDYAGVRTSLGTNGMSHAPPPRKAVKPVGTQHEMKPGYLQ